MMMKIESTKVGGDICGRAKNAKPLIGVRDIT
jgi:hypothetical protein